MNFNWGGHKCEPKTYRMITTSAKDNNTTIVTKTVTTIDANGVKTVKVFVNGVEQPNQGSTSAPAQGQGQARPAKPAGQTPPAQPARQPPPAQQPARRPSATTAAPARKLDVPKFEKDTLTEHNTYRAKHGCPPLKLNRELCDLAKDWAENLANRKAMEHRPNNKFGENIYMAGGMTVEASNAVKAWYDEIQFYKFDKEENDISKTGHFTQLVWKDTTEMGVAIAERGRSTWVVANYKPHGNIMTKFKDNVPALK